MNKLNIAINNALRNGCIKSNFAGPAPQLPEKFALDAGDTIFVPKDFVPLVQTVFSDDERERAIPFLYTIVRDKDGQELPFRLYPSIFTRTVRGTDGRFHRAGGNLVEKLCQFGTLKEAMEFLAGRAITVTATEEVETIRPFDGLHQVKRVHCFDLV